MVDRGIVGAKIGLEDILRRRQLGLGLPHRGFEDAIVLEVGAAAGDMEHWAKDEGQSFEYQRIVGRPGVHLGAIVQGDA